jgi:hypothetical protein
MLSSTFRRAATAAASRSNATINIAQRTMAMGPAQGGEISDELLAKLGSLSTQALVDGLWVMGWPAGKYISSIHHEHIITTLFCSSLSRYDIFTHHFMLPPHQLKLMVPGHCTLHTSASEGQSL